MERYDNITLVLRKADVAEWQTHQTQNLTKVTSCGFKSRHPHSLAGALYGNRDNVADTFVSAFFLTRIVIHMIIFVLTYGLCDPLYKIELYP